MTNHNILVLSDFTPAADIGISHAYAYAKVYGSVLNILHVVDKEQDIEPALEKLEAQAKAVPNYDDVIRLELLTVQASLFKGIGHMTNADDMDLMIMPTHGLRDMQYITGSRALKVIADSGIPAVVVQKETPVEPIYSILLAIFGEGDETPGRLNQVIKLAKYYDARVEVVYPNYKKQEDRDKVDASLDLVSTRFQQAGLNPRPLVTRHSMANFTDAILESQESRKPSMIALPAWMANQSEQKSQIPKSLHQRIITNKSFDPVFCF